MTALATVASGVTLTPRARQKDDWYLEPAAAVDALLDAEPFEGFTWDPACGAGNIPKRLNARGLRAVGSDLVDRGFGDSGRDFLEHEPLEPGATIDNIVCNPPFNLAEPFIRKALTLTTRKVAMLLRLSFLEGQKRRILFTTTPLARVHVFSWRVSMPPGDVAVKAKGGAVAFAWFVWEKGYDSKPTVGWL